MRIEKIIERINEGKEVSYNQFCRLLRADKRLIGYRQKNYFDDNGNVECSKWALAFKPQYCGLIPCSSTVYVTED